VTRVYLYLDPGNWIDMGTGGRPVGLLVCFLGLATASGGGGNITELHTTCSDTNQDVYDFSGPGLLDPENTIVDLNNFRNKVILLVNVATY